MLAASCAGVNLTAAITIGLVAPDSLRVDDLAPHWAVVFLEPPLLWIVVVQAVCFLSGAVIGIGHRRKRALAWEAEEHNERFLADHGLLVTDTDEDGNLRIRDTRTNTGYQMACLASWSSSGSVDPATTPTFNTTSPASSPNGPGRSAPASMRVAE